MVLLLVIEAEPTRTSPPLFSTTTVAVAKKPVSASEMVISATVKVVSTTETTVSVVLMSAFYAKRAVTISKMIVSRLVMNVSVPEFAYSALVTILKLFLRIIEPVSMPVFCSLMIIIVFMTIIKMSLVGC